MIFLLDGTFFPGWRVQTDGYCIILTQFNCYKMTQMRFLDRKNPLLENGGI